jgi:hypothetical protein
VGGSQGSGGIRMAEVLIDSRRPDEQRHLRTAGGVEH